MGESQDKSGAMLVFVGGPQKGRRRELASLAAVLGRNPACDIEVTEETVSRRQLQFELTADGWVVENVASTSFRINGKKYKAAKRIILDTGDVLAIGSETEMLFVAAGDDPEAALATYRDNAPAPQAAALPSQPAGASPQAQPPPAATDTPGASPEGETPQADSRRKVRKYVIGFGVYAIVMIAVLALLMHFKSARRPSGPGGEPLRKLTSSDIRESLSAEVEDVPRYATMATDALRDALGYYERALDNPGDLYRAVKYFKLHLAYRGGGAFDDVRHQRMFLDAQDKLIELVLRKYNDAWICEQKRQGEGALILYEHLERILPVKEDPYPDEDNIIFENIHAHMGYIRANLLKKKRRR